MNVRACAFLIAWLAPVGALFADAITIKGSNTFGEKLGPELIRAYQRAHPEAEFVLERAGTPSGIAALMNGECDLAAASRMLTEDELRAAKSRRLKLRTHTIGYYGLAVIVNEKNPVKGISLRELRDVFTGTITNWSALGGPDRPIVVVIHDESSGTRLGFQELAMENRPYAPGAISAPSYADIADRVLADADAIGYIALPLVPQSSPVRALRISGIGPTPIAIADDLYPLARRIRFFTVRGKEDSDAMKFVSFVRSAEGQAVLDRLGFVRWTQRALAPGLEVP